MGRASKMLTFISYASSSKGNLHEITDSHSRVMVDCGLSWRKAREAMFFATSGIGGVVATHAHSDHSKGLADAARSGLDCYALPETLEALSLQGHRFHPIKPFQQFVIGTFTVKAFPLEHDVPNCGFLFCNREGEKAIYITDTAYCRFKFGSGLRIIAIECNYSRDTLSPNLDIAVRNRLYSTHMSLDTVKGFLQSNDLSQVQEIHLLHGSDHNSDSELFKREVEKATGKPVTIAGS
jgi:phosphoribosyl 1,2-cyclic phosphodiesterase